MEELQLEETQRTNQQAQDLIPYDPNAADRFAEGYTPVGEGRDNTPVEQVNPVRVGEVEATAEINSDLGINNPQDHVFMKLRRKLTKHGQPSELQWFSHIQITHRLQ